MAAWRRTAVTMPIVNDPIQTLHRAFQHGLLVPVVGTGVSMPAGAPSWAGYLRQMQDQLPDGDPLKQLSSSGGDSYLDLADLLIGKLHTYGKTPPGVHLDTASFLHAELASWRLPLYLTTNYDNGLELALRGPAEVICADELQKVVLEPITANPRSQIVKLMTTTLQRSGETGTIASAEYARLLHRNDEPLELLVTLMRTRTLLFVGCGMSDPLINTALQRVHAKQVGAPRPHFAILPERSGEALHARLNALHVVPVLVSEPDITTGVLNKLQRIGRSIAGGRALVIYEPGTPTKLGACLDALDNLPDGTPRPTKVVVVTASAAIAKSTPRDPSLRFLHVADVADYAEVDTKIGPHLADVERINLVCPYEFAVGAAAGFIQHWRRVPAIEQGIPTSAAELSRDKAKFAARMSTLQNVGIEPIPSEVTTLHDLGPEPARALLDRIERFAAAHGASEVILKPVDAAASIGVRPIDVRTWSEAERLAVVEECLDIVHRMATVDETRTCVRTKLLMQPRVRGEEFSVECLVHSRVPEVLAIHWKVDIDSDRTRFFERLFVTLDRSAPEFARLERINNRLLQATYPELTHSAIHAEYRVQDGKVRPLEIALRPGGGMVADSVRSHRNASTYDAFIASLVDAWTPQLGMEATAVATGLIFARNEADSDSLRNEADSDSARNEADSERVQGPGVLGLIEVETAKGWQPLSVDTPEVLGEILRRRLRALPRADLFKHLEALLGRGGTSDDLRARCLAAFDHDRATCDVELDVPQLWMRPGDWVDEEEASYVGGLLIRARELHGLASMAEVLAAMQYCLSIVRCRVHPAATVVSADVGEETAHQVSEKWLRLKPGSFDSPEDSATFHRAVDLATLELGRNCLLIDLGCGSARPIVGLLRDHEELQYTGMDVDQKNIEDAVANLHEYLKKDRAREQRLFVGDVNRPEDVARLAAHVRAIGRTPVVIANLPYLPDPGGAVALARDVNGGQDGLKYVPTSVLNVATEVGSNIVVMNFSSLCDVDEITDRIAAAGWTAEAAIATCAVLGSYTRSLVGFYRAMPLRVFGSESRPRQVIYSLILRRSPAYVSPRLMVETARSSLGPETRPPGYWIESRARG